MSEIASGILDAARSGRVELRVHPGGGAGRCLAQGLHRLRGVDVLDDQPLTRASAPADCTDGAHVRGRHQHHPPATDLEGRAVAIHRIAADRYLGGDAGRHLCSRQPARDANSYGARDRRVHRGDPDPAWICALEGAWSAGDGRGWAHGRRSEREHGNRRPAGDPVLLLVAHQRGGRTRHDHCVLHRNRQCGNGHVRG